MKVRWKPKSLAKAITEAPRMAKGEMVEAASKYLIGSNRRGLKHYPNKRPNQKYIRTYKLRRGWTFKAERTKTRIYNSVEYAPFVQGDKDQAWMHAGRWRTVSKVTADNTKGMIHAADQALTRYLKSKGL